MVIFFLTCCVALFGLAVPQTVSLSAVQIAHTTDIPKRSLHGIMRSLALLVFLVLGIHHLAARA